MILGQLKMGARQAKNAPLVIIEKWVFRKYKKRPNLKIADRRSLFCFKILCWFTILRFAATNVLIIYIFWWHLCYRMHHIWIYLSSWIFSDVINVIHILQHIWTPDVIIHDLVRFNKPEILNQVQKFIKTSNWNIWRKKTYTLKKTRHRNRCTMMVSKVGALEIFRDKRVYYKVRSDITIVCKAMEFALYPLDNHKCYLILTSCKRNIWKKYSENVLRRFQILPCIAVCKGV